MYELHAVCDDGSGQAWPDHIHSAMCIEAYTIYDITRLSQAWPENKSGMHMARLQTN